MSLSLSLSASEWKGKMRSIRLVSIAATITSMCTAAAIAASEPKESAMQAGAISGFIEVCARAGYVLTDEAKIYIKKWKNTKTFEPAAATEAKGFSLVENCNDVYKQAYGPKGEVEAILGFVAVKDISGATSQVQRTQMISAAEVTQMEKICRTRMVLTPKALRFVKKSITSNRQWFKAALAYAAEEYSSDSACDSLMFDEYNTTSMKTKELGFTVWEEICPPSKIGQPGCRIE